MTAFLPRSSHTDDDILESSFAESGSDNGPCLVSKTCDPTRRLRINKKIDRTMSTKPESPKTVRSVPSEIEGAAIVAALADHGIKASTTGDFTSGFRAEAPGWVQVVVRSEDFEQAEQILSQLDAKQVDWSKVDVGEPEDEN